MTYHHVVIDTKSLPKYSLFRIELNFAISFQLRNGNFISLKVM